jgi:hypothetical protein
MILHHLILAADVDVGGDRQAFADVVDRFLHIGRGGTGLRPSTVAATSSSRCNAYTQPLPAEAWWTVQHSGSRRRRIRAAAMGTRWDGHVAAQRRGDHTAGGDRADAPIVLQGHLRDHVSENRGGLVVIAVYYLTGIV